MCALVVLGSTSCHKDSDDYVTTGSIELSLPLEGTVETIQYSLRMTNLNSHDIVTQAGETSRTIVVDNLWRGAYSINVEGVVRYVDQENTVHTSQFRAQSDYVPMVELDNNAIGLEMILMD